MKLNIKREAKIGFFITAMLFALYWGVNFLKGRDIFNRSNTYYAMYDQVNGIQPSSAIVIKGFKVGVISDMSYNPSISNNVILEFSIKSDYKVPVNSKARIYSDGLLGGKAIEIELGNSKEFLQNGDTLRTEMDKDFFEVAGSEFEQMKQMATVVVEELRMTLHNMNSILEQNSTSVNTTLTNVAAISGSLRQVVSMESDNMRSIISNINTLTETLEQNADRVDNIIGNIDGITDSLNTANIPQMINNLSSSLGQLNITLEKVNNGEGTVGKFIHDEALYDSLTMATSHLGHLLNDIQSNPKRYVHFSVFGKKDKKSK